MIWRITHVRQRRSWEAVLCLLVTTACVSVGNLCEAQPSSPPDVLRELNRSDHVVKGYLDSLDYAADPESLGFAAFSVMEVMKGAERDKLVVRLRYGEVIAPASPTRTYLVFAKTSMGDLLTTERGCSILPVTSSEVAYGSGETARARITAEFVATLCDTSVQTVVTALQQLAALGDTQVVGHIEPLLGDSRMWVRAEACAALLALGQSDRVPDAIDLALEGSAPACMLAFAIEARYGNVLSEEQALRMMRSDLACVREAGLQTLRNRATERVVGQLVPMLDHEDPATRYLASECLARATRYREMRTSFASFLDREGEIVAFWRAWWETNRERLQSQ